MKKRKQKYLNYASCVIKIICSFSNKTLYAMIQDFWLERLICDLNLNRCHLHFARF